jgi:hypothetical protein
MAWVEVCEVIVPTGLELYISEKSYGDRFQSVEKVGELFRSWVPRDQKVETLCLSSYHFNLYNSVGNDRWCRLRYWDVLSRV